jgi:hypothetical protein
VWIQPQALNQIFEIGMEKATVSHPPEAARQNDYKMIPKKLPARDDAEPRFYFGVMIAKSDG